MSELEKMLAGEQYDCADTELVNLGNKGKQLIQTFNQLGYAEEKKQLDILKELLGSYGDNSHISAPFYADYGQFIHFGKNCAVNMNCLFLDCNYIRVGDNTLIGPGVHIYTVTHPIRAENRFSKKEPPTLLAQSAPVTIGSNVWIGGNVTIMPGVTIGDHTVVGSGSVVTKSLPEGVIALGNPCKIIKELPE